MPSKVDKLITALGDQYAETRLAARLALMEIGAPAVESLLQNLHDQNAKVRQGVVEALGWIGDQRAVEPLIQALGDPDAEVRKRAACALGSTGDGRAVEPLMQALKDQDVEVGEHAAWALERIGDARALPELERVVREDTEITKWDKWLAAKQAAEKLRGRMNSPTVVAQRRRRGRRRRE